MAEGSQTPLYSLLLVDLLSPHDFFKTAFNGSLGEGVLHWAVYNVKGNDLSMGQARSDALGGPYMGPSNPIIEVPNSYVFLLFEHDAPADADIATPQPFTLEGHLTRARLGLKDLAGWSSGILSSNKWTVLVSYDIKCVFDTIF